MKVTGKNGNFTVTAYQGDAKTLLAFNLPDNTPQKNNAKDLAGFTIQVTPDGQAPYYLFNSLRFEKPGAHAQNAQEPANSSINAPIHKFRWLHVPGSFHQGIQPFEGKYTYTVTPRFFDAQHALLPIDPARSASVDIDVVPFEKKSLKLGFTRGFTQSQAFVHRFGLKALIKPKGKNLIFDTSVVSGTNPTGQTYTFEQEYEWLGYTARKRIFEVLNDVLASSTLSVKIFAYDFNEPDLANILLELAGKGRVQMILDNAALHHDSIGAKAEDQFEKLFRAAAKNPAAIMRGKFARYSHDKVFIVSDGARPIRVLTGSTNFSVTGIYVNSNHVLVFDDPGVADMYSQMFDSAWQNKTSATAFRGTSMAQQTFMVSSASVPRTEITFSPHAEPIAQKILDGLVARVNLEGKKAKDDGSVFFAVMEVGTGTGPVYPALRALHTNSRIFSYGISDTTSGISLYRPGTKKGVLVTGKPIKTQLPPPFDQVPSLGVGHQVHHKFVVCGFNGDDPVVYCGSSNLALGGEFQNGDNLLAIYDEDVATVFAIEAMALVDHFDFLDRVASKDAAKKKTKSKTPKPKKPEFGSKQQEADSVGWFLSTTDGWTKPYFDPKDLHYADRKLFGS